MKYTLKFLFFLGVMTLTFGSCTKNFVDINSNPNQPSKVATSYLLASAEKQLMDHTWDEWWNGRRGNQLAQYWSSNQYSSESRYQLRTNITNSYWTYFYAGRDGTGQPNGGGMADLQEIIRLCTDFPDEYSGYGDTDNQKAVATILKAWVFQNLTDCFGAIPFSEALQGSDFPNPAYDSQEDVYAGLLAMINEAIGLIKVGEMGPQGDHIYGGDMNKWLKFANSLKLRIAMRMPNSNDAIASLAVADAVASGVFDSNADNAHYLYGSSVPNNNPLNEDAKTRNDFAASNIMVDHLAMLNDPRMGMYYNPTAADGTFVGEVYGLTEEDAALTPDAAVSQRSDKVLAADFPGTYLDFAEVSFFLAEAVEEGYISGSAADYYNAGIQASMEYWGVDQAAIDAYIAQDAVDYATVIGNGASYQEAIGQQKWIALYMQGIEGWTEYRRLDFGILQPPAAGALDGDGNVPLRFTYPIDEQTLNGTSYSAAVAAQGADLLETSLWWDQ